MCTMGNNFKKMKGSNLLYKLLQNSDGLDMPLYRMILLIEFPVFLKRIKRTMKPCHLFVRGPIIYDKNLPILLK